MKIVTRTSSLLAALILPACALPVARAIDDHPPGADGKQAAALAAFQQRFSAASTFDCQDSDGRRYTLRVALLPEDEYATQRARFEAKGKAAPARGDLLQVVVSPHAPGSGVAQTVQSWGTPEFPGPTTMRVPMFDGRTAHFERYASPPVLPHGRSTGDKFFFHFQVDGQPRYVCGAAPGAD